MSLTRFFNQLKKVGASLLVLTVLSAAVGAVSLIVRRFGFGDIVTCMLSAVLGVAALIATLAAVMHLTRHMHNHNLNDMHSQLTYTLREIANGNFNVFVETDPHAPHNDIAEALNDMTRKLGTMESMRQDFISNVSHEIQSPLTSISGFAKLLRDEHLPAKQRLHYIEIIETESARLSCLSENLLKLSSLDQSPLNKSAFRLDKQLENIILTLEPQWAAKNIELALDRQKYTINADEDLLSEVWINLLVNAIKFTPEGGTVTVTMKDGAVRIADTGCGLSNEDRVHVFERFYKADKARARSMGGNGLGLSIVKKIVERHGGKVTFDSEIGRGTVFTVNLPEK